MKKHLFFIIALTITISLANTDLYGNTINNTQQLTDSIKPPHIKLKKYISFFNHLFEKKKKTELPKFTIRPNTTTSPRFEELKNALSSGKITEKKWYQKNIKVAKYDTESDSTSKVVFGFHPYWMDKAYKNYNYNLLTDIAIFAANIDSYNNTLEIPDYLKKSISDITNTKNSCNLYLTVTYFTTSYDNTFLKDTIAKQKIKNTVVDLVNQYHLKGVVLDFEGIHKPQQSNFENFVSTLADTLKVNDKKLCITIPAINSDDIFDIDILKEHVYYFLLMGYDFYGSWSKIAGPSAPLLSQPTWGGFNIQNSVNYYLTNGLPNHQLILTVPYYGNQWQTEDLNVPSKVLKYDSHISYSEIKQKIPKQYSYDQLSKTGYYNTIKKGKNIQFWFDDSISLAQKYDLINREELAGVGIWALGYDMGHTELWSLLDTKFGIKKGKRSIEPITSLTGITSLTQLQKDKDIHINNPLLKIVLLIIATMITLACLLSLRRQIVRDFLLKHNYTTLAFLTILIIVICWWGFQLKFTKYVVIALAGMLIGYALQLLYSNKNTLKFSKSKLP